MSCFQWYKQNRELKRRSTALLQRVAEAAPDGAFLQLLAEADQTDATAAGDAVEDDELDALRNTVKQLSAEVARLQAELNAARLDEFEAQEAAISAAADLEAARQVRNVTDLTRT